MRPRKIRGFVFSVSLHKTERHGGKTQKEREKVII